MSADPSKIKPSAVERRALADLRRRLTEAIETVLDDQAGTDLGGRLGYQNDRTAEMMADAALLVFEHSSHHEKWLTAEGYLRE